MKFLIVSILLTLTHCVAIAQWVLLPAPHFLNAVGKHGQYLFVGGEENGAFRSSDNGESWISVNNGIHSDSDPSPATVEAIDGVENFIFSTVDYGGSYISFDDGDHWSVLFHRLPFFSFITYHGKLFTALYGGNGVWVSSDTGKTWDTDSVGLFSGWAPDKQKIYTTPVVSNDELYTTNEDGFVYRSTNDGNSWTLTYDRIEASFKRLYAINDTTLFVCTMDSIFRSTNRGVTWKNIKQHTGTGPLVTTDNFIIAVQGYLISISSDNGDTWKSVNGNLPDSVYIESMTVKDGYVFGATNQGLWRRPLSDFASVAVQPKQSTIAPINVKVIDDRITVEYFSEVEFNHPKFEVYDILGRLISSSVERYAQKGWNTITIPITKLPSGTYICRAIGSGFTQSRTFQISW